MEAKNASSVLTVTEPEAVDFLCDPERHRLLEPFFEEQSVSGAARALGEPLYRMARQVGRMARAGLLVETRALRRGGRAVRLYRTAAERFFVPFERRSFEELLLELTLARHRRQAGGIAVEWARFADTNQGWGLSVYRTLSGRVSCQMPTTPESAVSPPPASPTLMLWRELRLIHEDARALERRLAEVLGEYAGRDTPQGRPFMLGLSMAPLP